ncbi:AFG1/ZapE family ATPase [Arthrobacter sp. ISL-5]|uniref:AFG1/ZapE family ATPase n=1 Tax=Arthrobacter sp. ISL-5 TaxID=2819111 RepID=UPI001BEC535F|nr:AFG1/ZapE family ATPase [Arthrobacter sp. ISL-5]MBT2554288.1 cell division protein ZapE [Arthrobacter sp. ISL-5]
MTEFQRGLIISPGTERQLGAYGLFRPSPPQQQVLALPSGPLTVRSADPDVLWVSFAELCARPRTDADHMALAGQFPSWVIDGVPSPAVPAATGSAAAWHRFLDIVDVLHDRDRVLFLVGAGPLDWAAAARTAALPAEEASVLARIAERLSSLRRIESDEELEDELTAGC